MVASDAEGYLAGQHSLLPEADASQEWLVAWLEPRCNALSWCSSLGCTQGTASALLQRGCPPGWSKCGGLWPGLLHRPCSQQPATVPAASAQRPAELQLYSPCPAPHMTCSHSCLYSNAVCTATPSVLQYRVNSNAVYTAVLSAQHVACTAKVKQWHKAK